MRNQSGFSLMELMTVMAIVAIVTAVAVPNFISWLPDHRLRSAADDINTSFQFARMQAVRENGNVTIEVDAANDELIVFLDDGSGGGVAGNRVRDGGEQAFKIIEMPAGIDLTANRTWFGYTGRGMPLGNAFGSIFLENTRSHYLGVSTNFAGNPRFIHSDNGSTWN
jgi:type IV fimbrial biogenesis protein FimT